MVTTIQNVTKDMDFVLCHASNGYGVPTQTGKKIRISCKFNVRNFSWKQYLIFTLFWYEDAPRIQPSGITLSLAGERVELKCVVKARPTPKVIFWRDSEGNQPVPLGSNYEMSTDSSSDVRY